MRLACQLLLGAALLNLPSPAQAASDRQTRTVALPPERSLSIAATIGTVEIAGSDTSDATIEIVRHAPRETDLARVPIEVEETEQEVRIKCLQRDGTDPALRCDVSVRVPKAARVSSIHVMEGRVRLIGLSGNVTADVRRGPIDATDIAGTFRLEAGIGHVVVKNARLTAGGLLRLRAFNGDVRLSLAERPTDARILALALNGTISSGIPLNMKDTWGPRWGEATLGKGEPVISIDVITGRIEIKSP